MADKFVPEDKRYIDPMFALPEGASGFEYAENNTSKVDDFGAPVDDVVADEDDIQGEGDAGVESDSYVDVSLDEYSDDSGAPDAPTELTIVSQNAHFATTGQQVVDLVVDVPSDRGIMKYEFRVTKIQ